MIYILIALVLFGALTAILARQGGQSDSENLSEETAQFQATQLLAFAQSAQSAVNQMIMSGSQPDDLIFDRPNVASFDNAPFIHKVFHPDGGGLILQEANSELFSGTDNDPAPGWYMGRFNNIEWTPSTGPDIILTAHQISQIICETINEKITGTRTIPAIAAGNLADYLIDESEHTGSNADFDTAVCNDCDGYANLCISNAAADMFDYYVIIEGL